MAAFGLFLRRRAPAEPSGFEGVGVGGGAAALLGDVEGGSPDA